MNYLIFSDPHFTDNPIDDYRWSIFDFLKSLIHKHLVTDVFCLGDVVDRKDRHTGVLVNRLEQEFNHIKELCPVTIISGNHDKPLTGPYYWEFLNSSNINYITKPFEYNPGLWLLPFTPNPVEDWRGIDFNKAKALFIHQTVAGALVEGDRVLLQGQVLPPIPNTCMIFSGDVHRPQIHDNIVYIGGCAPVRFGESWANRVILIRGGDFKNYLEIPVDAIRRDIVEISKAAELKKLKYKKNDQLRIRYKLSGKDLTGWPVEQELIKTWAKEKGIHLASVEAVIAGNSIVPSDKLTTDVFELMKPDEVVTQFCLQEKLSDDIKEMGITLLKDITK